MPQPRVPVVRGHGRIRPTYAAELLRARRRLSVVDLITVVLRRARAEAGMSQREYAAAHGISKSQQGRLEAHPEELRLQEVIAALAETGHVLTVVRAGQGRTAGTSPGVTAAELLARDGAGRRFPAARPVQRVTTPPEWWWSRHGTNLLVREPEWTTVRPLD